MYDKTAKNQLHLVEKQAGNGTQTQVYKFIFVSFVYMFLCMDTLGACVHTQHRTSDGATLNC